MDRISTSFIRMLYCVVHVLKVESVVLKSIEKKTARQLFNSLEQLELHEISLDDPGNMTYFIRFEHKGQPIELKWGGNQPVPDQLRTYYRLLRQLTRETNPTM